jgi:RNA polymerase sigma-70 factor (ECF subfamily)
VLRPGGGATMSAIPSEDWGDLYTEYCTRIQKYIYRRTSDFHLAEDLTAETFVKAIDNSSNGGGSQSSFSGWLFRIAHNLVIDHYRARDRSPSVSIDDVLQLSDGSNVEAQTEVSFDVEAIADVLLLLVEEQREVFIMRFEHDYSFAEIAKEMNKTEGAVKKILMRACGNIDRLLQPGAKPLQRHGCQVQLAIVLDECGPMTVTQIVNATGLERKKALQMMHNHPGMFCKVGSIKEHNTTMYVWGLVGVHDRRAA